MIVLEGELEQLIILLLQQVQLDRKVLEDTDHCALCGTGKPSGIV